MMEFLAKMLLLPIMLLAEVYGVFVALIGIIEIRAKMFFSDDIFEEDYHTNTTTRKIVLSIPFGNCYTCAGVPLCKNHQYYNGSYPADNGYPQFCLRSHIGITRIRVQLCKLLSIG